MYSKISEGIASIVAVTMLFADGMVAESSWEFIGF